MEEFVYIPQAHQILAAVNPDISVNDARIVLRALRCKSMNEKNVHGKQRPRKLYSPSGVKRIADFIAAV